MMSASTADLSEIDSVDEARELLEALQQSPLVCAWCFSRLRETAPEYDEAEALHLATRDKTQAFEARGHRFRADGSVSAGRADLRPAPDATVEHAPDGGTAIACPGCGSLDAPAPQQNRTASEYRAHFETLIGLDLLDCEGASPVHGRMALEGAIRDPENDDLDTLAAGLAAYLP